MAMTYKEGQEYVRPNVYRRSSNAGNNTAVASARDGFGALPIQADWGPLGEVTTHYSTTATTISKTYGSSGTVKVANAFMTGGINTLYLIRLGAKDSGKAGTLTLQVAESTDAITLTLKYPGKHPFTASVRTSLSDENTKEIVIYDGATAVETISFAVGDVENEVEAAIAAVTAANSNYITAAKIEEASGKLKDVAQQAFEGGEDPTVTNDDYRAAFEAFEPYFYNTIALDTTATDVQALLVDYLSAAYEEGNLGFCVLGSADGDDFEKRNKAASANNDYRVIYFGSSYISVTGEKISGAEAIATVAGVIASVPSNESITHRSMPQAANITERLKNREYEEAIKNGLLLLSVNGDGQVVFDSGINTLVNPSSDQDDGWKKIKRAKVRHEAYNRLDREMDKLIGKIQGDPDGIANVIQRGQAVLDAMAAERKLIDPTFILDPEKGYGADYGYFVIDAVDVDTLERIFLHYRWKYSANS